MTAPGEKCGDLAAEVAKGGTGFGGEIQMQCG